MTSCSAHGWWSSQIPCPNCVVQTTSSSSSLPGLVGVDSDHYESLKQEVASLKAKLAVAVSDEWLEINKWKPYLHYCAEWDGLLIDKGDLEFDYCMCFPTTNETKPEAP